MGQSKGSILVNKMGIFVTNSSDTLNKAGSPRWLIQAVLCFIAIQPLIDNFYLFNAGAPSLGGIMLPTLFRYAGVSILFGVVIQDRKVRAKSRFLWVFLGLSLLFLVAHVAVNRSFTTFLPADPYSMTSEIAYVIRLVMPFVFFFVCFHLDITRKELVRVVQVVVLVTLVMVIVSNLTLTSLGSYSNKVIRGNIFSWFGEQYIKYSDLASKGWFNFANQLSAYLMMLLPLIVYSAVEERSKLSLVLLLFSAPAMLMVGTKVAFYGVLLILLLAFGLYLFVLARDRKHVVFHVCALVLLLVLLLGVWKSMPYTPAIKRGQVSANVVKQTDLYKNGFRMTPHEFTIVGGAELRALQHLNNLDRPALLTEFSKEEKRLILNQFMKTSLINRHFYTKAYPYRFDQDFWLEALLLPAELQKDSRYMEVAMIQRMKDVNNRGLDTWLGLGNSRIQAVFNIERDYVNQYYAVGVLGVLLFLSVYPLWAVLAGLWVLRRLKERLTIFNLMCIATLGIPVLVSVASGNTIDSLLITLTTAFVAGVWWRGAVSN